MLRTWNKTARRMLQRRGIIQHLADVGGRNQEITSHARYQKEPPHDARFKPSKSTPDHDLSTARTGKYTFSFSDRQDQILDIRYLSNLKIAATVPLRTGRGIFRPRRQKALCQGFCRLVGRPAIAADFSQAGF